MGRIGRSEGAIDEENSTRHRTVEEVQLAVSRLSREELNEFREWYEEFDAEVWDREFEEDVKAGRLDALAEKAMENFRAGRYTES